MTKLEVELLGVAWRRAIAGKVGMKGHGPLSFPGYGMGPGTHDRVDPDFPNKMQGGLVATLVECR